MMQTQITTELARSRKRLRSAVMNSIVLAGAAFALSACATFGGAPGAEPPREGEDTNMDAQIEEVIGEWVSDETGEPRLEFSEDGVVRGTDGCNGIHTRYALEDDRIVLETFASTLKACPGVNDWLRSVREVSVEGSEMLVKDGSGAEIGRLQRV